MCDAFNSLQNVETLMSLKVIEKSKENERVLDALLQEKIRKYDESSANYLKKYEKFCNIINCCLENSAIESVSDVLEPAAKKANNLETKLIGMETWSAGILHQLKFFNDDDLKPVVTRKTRKILKSTSKDDEHGLQTRVNLIDDIKTSKGVTEKCIESESGLTKSCTKTCLDTLLENLDSYNYDSD